MPDPNRPTTEPEEREIIIPFDEIANRAISETRDKALDMRAVAELKRKEATILLKEAELLIVESHALDRMANSWDGDIEDALHP